MKTVVEFYERYLCNSQDEIDFYDQLGISLPEKFDYRLIKIPIDDIIDTEQVSDIDTKITCYNGFEIVVFGNADEIFIKINDLKNNEIEDDSKD